MVFCRRQAEKRMSSVGMFATHRSYPASKPRKKNSQKLFGKEKIANSCSTELLLTVIP